MHLLFIYVDEGFPPSTQSLTSPSWLIRSGFNTGSGQQSSKFKSNTGYSRANATMVVLARNSEVEEVVGSMLQLEERFNWKFGYPWVFLNDVPFSEEFIA